MDSVLFLSMHDSSRGPIAATLFNTMVDRALVIARSAGFYPGPALDPLVISSMADAGLPLTDHRAPTTDLRLAEGRHVGAETPVVVESFPLLGRQRVSDQPAVVGLRAFRPTEQLRMVVVDP